MYDSYANAGAKMPVMMGAGGMGGPNRQDLMLREGQPGFSISQRQPQSGMPMSASALQDNPMFDELARAFMASRMANVSADPERNTKQFDYRNPMRPRTRIPTEVAKRFGIDFEQAQRGFRSPQEMFGASSYSQQMTPMSYMK